MRTVFLEQDKDVDSGDAEDTGGVVCDRSSNVYTGEAISRDRRTIVCVDEGLLQRRAVIWCRYMSVFLRRRLSIQL